MNEKLKAFFDVYESTEGKEILALGYKIKRLDKSNDRRMQFIIFLSITSMAFLGYFALGGVFGAILFLGIAAIASFGLYYSSKKNVLLKYLTFYRSRIPKMIAMADGVEVTAEEIPDRDFVATLSIKGQLSYRMCHRYGDIYVGFAKFMSGPEPILQGLIYYTNGNCSSPNLEELLREEFGDFVWKCENGKSMLFIPGVEDYLGGRVEMKDDLTFPALARQFDYYLLGKSFKSAANGMETDSTVFHTLV